MPTLNKLEYLDETKQQIKNALNTNFNSQIQDTDTFRSYVSKINDIYTNWAKVTGEGTALNLTPTKKGRLQSTLKGATSQDGTPTPDTPIPIKVVTGDNSVVIIGKNLYDKNNLQNGYVNNSGVFVANNSWKTTEFISVASSTNYTISNVINRYLICQYTAPNEESFVGTRIDKNISTTFTTGATTKYIRISPFVFNNSYEIIQLEQGSTATDYVPYQQQTYPISLGSMELAEITENYQDYIYGSPNNWYKKNFIGKVVLDGTEAWTNMGWSTSLGYAFRTPINDMKQTSSASDLPNCISNYYQNYTYNNLQSTTIDYGIANRTNYAQIVFRNDDYTSATDFKDWLTTHNTTVYYILATPTEEQITDTTLITQLNNLYNATSQDGTTYITCSSASDSNEAIIINATALMKGGI